MKVVTNKELGGPVERLREQMKILAAQQLKEKEELPKIKYSDLEFVETVGSGGFGEVWKGQWKSKDKPVAIKKSRFGEMEREVGQCGSVVDNIMPALTSSVRTYKA